MPRLLSKLQIFIYGCFRQDIFNIENYNIRFTQVTDSLHAHFLELLMGNGDDNGIVKPLYQSLRQIEPEFLLCLLRVRPWIIDVNVCVVPLKFLDPALSRW